MDTTEDVSARVLLKGILVNEPPRTPAAHSDPQGAASSRPPSTRRTRQEDLNAQTPKDLLRRSQKRKIRESVTRKSLPPTTLRRTSVRQTRASSAASMLVSDEYTPRQLLQKILQTEPTRTPVVHKERSAKEPVSSSDDNTTTRTHSSMELSGLDLPDVTMEGAVSTAKVLRRKRPRQSLNVTAFEKRLKKNTDDGEPQTESSDVDHSSLSLSSSSTSLTLKTPFVDVQTEKKAGLRRRVSQRNKVMVERFAAAVENRHLAGMGHGELKNMIQGETAHIEGLNLSKLSEPNITMDIVHCNTALYDQTSAIATNISVTTNQIQPTDTSRLDKDMVEVEHSDKGRDGSPINEYDEADQRKEESSPNTGSQIEGDDAETESGAQQEEVESQTEEEGQVEFPPESAETPFESEELEAAASSQTEEEEHVADADDEATESQSGDVEGGRQTEEEETDPDRETDDAEKGLSNSQMDLETAGSQSDEGSIKSQSEDQGKIKANSENVQTDEATASPPSQNDVGQISPEKSENVPEFQFEGDTEEDEREKQESDTEKIIRQAHRSEGVLLMAVAEKEGNMSHPTGAGSSALQSGAHSTFDLIASLETGSNKSESRKPDGDIAQLLEEEDGFHETKNPDGEIEEPVHPLDVTHDIEVDEDQDEIQIDNNAAAPLSEEEDWVDEDDDNSGCKTPEFVKEKRNFSDFKYPVSTSASGNLPSSTNEALPAAKPKQPRKRNAKTGPLSKDAALPRAYVMNVFRHFAKTKVSTDIFPVLNEIMHKFFDRLAEDLKVFAAHAKRNTITFEDCVLLLKRQGHVNDKVPVEVLIEKFLRMDQRRILIPIATSGNVVIPESRK